MRSRLQQSSAAFTFLELIIVLGVVSCLFLIGIPTFKGMAPKYRLRSAARNIGSTLESTRIAAMSRGLWMGMHYVLTPTSRDDTDGSYYQIIPPPPEEFPDQPIADRQLLPKTPIASGVRIAKVILSSGQVIDRGSINVLFSPMGNAGSHIVVLEGAEERIMSLKMSSITGVIEFYEGSEPAFQHYTE